MKPLRSSVVMCLCTVASDVSRKARAISSKLGEYPCLFTKFTKKSRTSFCLLVSVIAFTPDLDPQFRRIKGERQSKSLPDGLESSDCDNEDRLQRRSAALGQFIGPA